MNNSYVRAATTSVLTGVVAAVQALLITWGLLAVLAVAAFTITSGSNANLEFGWLHAVEVGSQFWLLGHGIPQTIGGLPLTITPLTLLLFLWYVAYKSAVFSGLPDWWALAGQTLSYGLGAVLITAVFSPVDTETSLWLALLLPAVVAGLGGLYARARLTEVTKPAWLPNYLWDSIPMLRVSAAVTGILGLIIALAWFLLNIDTYMQMTTYLSGDWLSLGVLTFTQISYLGNVGLWSLAWVLGPGIHLGTAELLTPMTQVTHSLPSLPILTVFPNEPAPSARWLMLAWIVGLALLAWWKRPKPGVAWWHPLVSAATFAVLLTAGFTLLQLYGGGFLTAGGGLLGYFGVPVAGFLWRILVYSLVPVTLVWFLAHPRVRKQIREWSEQLTARITGAGNPESAS